MSETLAEIFDRYGSDKGTGAYLADSAFGPSGYIGHRYADKYPWYLEPVRDSVTRVLEIGVLDGASVRGWRDYFPNATVVGFDIDTARAGRSNLERILLIKGDQKKHENVEELKEFGPYDLIVDDGPHIPALQISTFEQLFFDVKPGGFYIVEDVQTQFFPENGPSTIVMDYFANLALKIQANGTTWLSAYFPDSVFATLDKWQQAVEFVHVFRYFIVIGKSNRV